MSNTEAVFSESLEKLPDAAMIREKVFVEEQGFETEFVMTPGKDPAAEDDDVDMTEEQIQMLIDFITGIDFVDAAK